MIRELMHDPIFLGGRSENASRDDIEIANDLLETLIAHKESCVGMAANMIGEKKRIIAFLDESGKAPTYTLMFNPEIIKRMAHIIRKRDACPSSAVRDLVSGIKASR